MQHRAVVRKGNLRHPTSNFKHSPRLSCRVIISSGKTVVVGDQINTCSQTHNKSIYSNISPHTHKFNLT